MKRFTVRFSPSATKELEALPAEIQERVERAVVPLADNPRPLGSRKLKGADNQYRIRVGRYRVIYEIHEKEVVVLIVRISHRKDAYR